jgi:hypothetical protein
VVRVGDFGRFGQCNFLIGSINLAREEEKAYHRRSGRERRVRELWDTAGQIKGRKSRSLTPQKARVPDDRGLGVCAEEVGSWVWAWPGWGVGRLERDGRHE